MALQWNSIRRNFVANKEKLFFFNRKILSNGLIFNEIQVGDRLMAEKKETNVANKQIWQPCDYWRLKKKKKELKNELFSVSVRKRKEKKMPFLGNSVTSQSKPPQGALLDLMRMRISFFNLVVFNLRASFVLLLLLLLLTGATLARSDERKKRKTATTTTTTTTTTTAATTTTTIVKKKCGSSAVAGAR